MSERADVVVVGGGILGVSIAHALSKLGRHVVLLEERTIASGTTGTSFAWLNATSKTDDAVYHALNRRGLEKHLALAAEWGETATGLAGAGSIHWSHPAAGDGGPAPLLAAASKLAAWDYPIVPLDRSALRALEPYIDFPAGSEGYLAPLDRWLDAPRMVRRMADDTRDKGGDIREGAPVTGFLFDGDAVVGVEALLYTILAPTIVLAAGTALPALAARARRSLARTLPVRPMPGLLVDTVPSDRTWLRHVVYFPDGSRFHMRPSGRGQSLGADDIDAAHTISGEDSLLVGTTALLHRASDYLPDFSALELTPSAHARIGVRPMPEDGLPIIGPLAKAPSVYVAATHSGVTLGPYLGELIAREIALDEPQKDLDPYRPGRFGQ